MYYDHITSICWYNNTYIYIYIYYHIYIYTYIHTYTHVLSYSNTKSWQKADGELTPLANLGGPGTKSWRFWLPTSAYPFQLTHFRATVLLLVVVSLSCLSFSSSSSSSSIIITSIMFSIIITGTSLSSVLLSLWYPFQGHRSPDIYIYIYIYIYLLLVLFELLVLIALISCPFQGRRSPEMSSRLDAVSGERAVS